MVPNITKETILNLISWGLWASGDLVVLSEKTSYGYAFSIAPLLNRNRVLQRFEYSGSPASFWQIAAFDLADFLATHESETKDQDPLPSFSTQVFFELLAEQQEQF